MRNLAVYLANTKVHGLLIAVHGIVFIRFRSYRWGSLKYYVVG